MNTKGKTENVGIEEILVVFLLGYVGAGAKKTKLL